MTDQTDNSAAERLARFAETWTANGGGEEIQTVYDLRDRLSFPALTVTDLLAVLADNQQMREKLDGIGRQLVSHDYGVRYDWADGTSEIKAFDDLAVAEEEAASDPQYRAVVQRKRTWHKPRIGEWQPADTPPGPDAVRSAPPAACGPTPNALICACGLPLHHDRGAHEPIRELDT